MHNILITGGAGFIGRQVVAEMNAKKQRAIVLDNFSVGKLTPSLQNMAKVYSGSISDTTLLDSIISKEKINVVIHLAALHYIPYCDEHPEEVMNTNVCGTVNILAACKKHGIKRLLFASSAAVYKPKLIAHTEADEVGPVDIYGISKKMAENLIQDFCVHYKIDYTIMRLFNVCGEMDLTPHLIPELINQAKNKTEITLGNVNTKRDYVRKEDVASAFLTAIDNKKCFNEIFNVGTGKSISVKNVFSIINKHTGNILSLKTVQHKKRKKDRKDLVANITKFQTTTNWHPKHTVHEYIASCFA